MAYTKEQLVEAVKKAVGGTPYGDELVEKAELTWGDKDHKYGQDFKDRLDESLGVLKAYERLHRDSGENAKAVSEAEKIVIIEKALEAVEGLQ